MTMSVNGGIFLAGRGPREESARVGGTGRSPVTTESGDNLLPRIAAGDPDAINAAIERYGPLIWSLARRLLDRPADAEDAVQASMIAIWQSADRFDPGRGSEIAFVATIARRRIIDATRRCGRIRRAEREAARVESVDVDVTLDTICADQFARVDAALEKLDPGQRDVLRLALQHDRSHHQIASQTGMPLGTVKTHARRGLIRLRELLKGRAS